MLGQGISALAFPVAVAQGLRARRSAEPRGFGVAGLVLGLFCGLLVGLQAVGSAVGLRGAGAGDGGALRPLPCDCTTVAAGATLELRLVGEAGEGPAARVRGSSDTVVLQAEPLARLEDVTTLAALQAADGTPRILLTFAPEATERLRRQAQPGTRLAVLVNGECVHVSTVQATLPGSMMLTLPLTQEEACALQCALP